MTKKQTLCVMFYVQHLLGIGHLMRARHIALALQKHDIEVTLVTGGLPIPGFDVPGVNQVALPAIAVSGPEFNELVDARGLAVDEQYKQRRCELLLETYRTVMPDIVLIEAFPFGRRQVRFELLPLIDAIEASAPRPKLLASVRDVLQSRTKPGRNEETVALIQKHFDKVLVHGDPQFIKFESSFPLAKDIAGKLIYTGLVCGRKPKALPNCQFDMLVSAGGGAVGAQLVRAAMDAAKLLPGTYSWCVIVGPKLPEKEFLHICDSAPANVMVERFRADFIDLLASVKLSVSQAGYNTVCDVLRSGCRSVLVPFATGGETEQTARAQRLQALGMATMLLETEISAQKLATAITRELHRSVRNHIGMINLDGAAQTGKILNKLMN